MMMKIFIWARTSNYSDNCSNADPAACDYHLNKSQQQKNGSRKVVIEKKNMICFKCENENRTKRHSMQF